MLNISASTVQKWESGAKRPSGVALKLLDVVSRHGVLARDHAIENWLQNVVCPAYDALQAAPENVRTVAQVRARIDVNNAKSR